MGNRLVPIVLVVLLTIIQAQLWFGRGSLPNAADLERQVKRQKAANEETRRTNEQLSAEVNDLKEGLNMVEERARHELGMVKPNEIFVQIAK
ncbi:cell division protein FtsB [Limnohabitans sp. T6-5]|uniref:cell division protein FtsB n=1 Tax=Limnohabitans sp. T6-5 TaxID=1100724 RepID=UPI000D35416E|nr:cell division protein FtsB [Limnohabitans sp. T6-5]PUE09066.1 cell division protein FtsB [Limnohabitans sp. T6-5]